MLHRLLTSFLAMAMELFKLRQVDFAKELNTLVVPDVFLLGKLSRIQHLNIACGCVCVGGGGNNNVKLVKC